MRRHRNKIIIGICIALLLAVAYWCGGHTSRTDSEEISAEKDERGAVSDELFRETEKQENAEQAQESEKIPDKAEEGKTENVGNSVETRTEKIQMQSPDAETLTSTEPQTAQPTQEQYTCTLSVSCDTVLKNMALLHSEKKEIIPKNGVIFAEQKVTFYEGESVFHLLLREMKKNKIHLEYVRTPIYNSAYIEGIANLYELDCGELSGWRYKVNGTFPNYGCSRYLLKEGDVVEWVYTCDLGVDVGGYFADGGGQRDE